MSSQNLPGHPMEGSTLNYVRTIRNGYYDQEIDANDYNIEASLSRLTLRSQKSYTIISSIRWYTYPYYQLLRRCKVPSNFFDRCSMQLRQSILDEHCKSNSWLVRCLSNGVARGMLSRSYSTFADTEILLTAIQEVFNSRHLACNVIRQEFDTTMDRVVIPTAARATIPENNIDYTPCINVTNSEVGAAAVWIEPAVEVRFPNSTSIVISNRSISKQIIPKIIHRGKLDLEKISEAIDKSIEVSQAGALQLIEWMNSSPEDLNEDKELLSQEIELPDASGNGTSRVQIFMEMEERLLEVKDRKELLGNITRITEAWPLVQLLKLEATIGKRINLFSGHEQRLSRIVEVLENEQ